MTQGREDHDRQPPKVTDAVPEGPSKGARARRRHRVGWFGLCLITLLLALGVALAAMALTGRSLALPVWAVAQIESKLNDRIPKDRLPQGSAVSLGGVELALERNFTPRILLRDLRLLDPRGESVLVLPELRASFAPGALLSGRLRLSSVRLSGAQIAIARDASGRLSLRFGQIEGAPPLRSAAEALDAVEAAFATPALAGLRLIEADALTLTLDDARAGRAWSLGDGRLTIENRPDALAAELGLTLLEGAVPAQARVLLTSSRADSSARLSATIDQVQATDLAEQAPPLGLLGLLDSPISGRIEGGLDASGQLAAFTSELTLGPGRLRPGPKATPVPFETAALTMHYDPQRQRVSIDRLAVESKSLRVSAKGTTDMLDASGAPMRPGALPAAGVVQLTFDQVMVDPEGLFEVPARFTGGAAAVRIWRAPFRVEIGNLSLFDGPQTVSLQGQIGLAAEGRWQGGLDVALNRIGTDRLIKLWPVSVVPRTRDWVASNVGQGDLLGVAAALRFTQGEPPRFALDYEFEGAEVRVVRSLPPVMDGAGRSSIKDNAYTVVIDRGYVTAPKGGQIDVAGTLFRVPDITQKPADAEVRLVTRAALTATLSLLDQEPFRFISKAGRKVDLGRGTARMVSELRFPLKDKLLTQDVHYDVRGRVTDFSSDQLWAGKMIQSPDLEVTVTPKGMTVSGKGRVEDLPVEARYELPFGKDKGGHSHVTGTARITDKALRGLGVALPQGWLQGETTAKVRLDLPKGAPARLELDSGLTGAGLAIGALGWSKAAGAAGKLRLEARLGEVPEVTRLSLEAPGLSAQGRITLKKTGVLDRASFSQLRVGGWLDATAVVEGRGANRQPAIALTGGRLDLVRRPAADMGQGSGAGGATELSVALDRLEVTSSIALTGVSGKFLMRQGGLDGNFVAAVNGIGRLSGAAMPYRGGTAVRLTSQDAGRVMAAAGIFSKGRGGQFDMTLQPRGEAGHYYGLAKFSDISLQNAPALAELLSAASIVGLLEQLNGNGILFNTGEVELLIRPDGVQITRGSAIGASMGISFAGVYRAASHVIDLQGTISPLYLLNGVGEIFGRRGEGLFGFNYRMAGPVGDPQVSVNPLSILTPGMFRDLFRRAPPKLGGKG